ncbi:hypothetical protein VTK56DRAFT_9373 [Thermocarpiscus australiensis]
MEAAGAASAILTFIHFALKATSHIYDLYSTFKHARDTVFRTTRDLRDLILVLEQMLDVVNGNRGRPPTREAHARVLEDLFARDDNPVTACRAEIASILKLLDGPRITWPVRKKDIEKHLDNVERYKTQLGLAVQSHSMAALLDVEKILASQTSLLRQHIEEEVGRKAFHWLNPPDVTRNLRAALGKRQPGTGDWFISSSSFRTWLSTPQFLWLTGIPGAGKTVLSSTIVATLLSQEERSSNAVVFFYFDFQNMSQQQPDALLRAVLAQLAVRSPAAFKYLRELHDACSASGSPEPSWNGLLDTVMTALTGFPRIFLVVDALDECSDRRTLLRHIKALRELPNVHVIALSRRERDIELALQNVAIEVQLTAADVDKDIAAYIKHRMAESQDMKYWRAEDKERVQAHLTSKAGGMFRWARCQLDALESCGSSEEITEVLHSLPKDLPDTYERILARVDRRQVRAVRTILVALAFSTEALTINEVSVILRTSASGKPWIKDVDIYWSPLLTACSSLVSISSTDIGHLGFDIRTSLCYLRLAHFSVKEYLSSEEIRRSKASSFSVSSSEGNRIMAMACISYLLHHGGVESSEPCLSVSHFTHYAVRNWVAHAKQADGGENERTALDDRIFELVHSGLAGFWEVHKYGDRAGKRIHSPLVYAAKCNFWRAVETILAERLARRRDRDQADLALEVKKAMKVAVKGRAYEAMDRLVRMGNADVNACYKKGRTLLHYSRDLRVGGSLVEGNRENAVYGDTDMVRWLIARGADAQASHTGGPGVVQYFSAAGFGRGLAILMESGADPEGSSERQVSGSIWLATPLQCAAYWGRLDCLDILLKHGAAVNRMEGRVGSAIHAAAFGGLSSEDKDSFRYLLDKGADIRLASEQYGSVLWAAGYGGNPTIIETCLERGLCWDDFVDSRLQEAKGQGWKNLSSETRKYLVDRVTDVARERHCKSLEEAVKWRMPSVVQKLLAKGEVDVEVMQYALCSTVYRRDLEMFNLLVHEDFVLECPENIQRAMIQHVSVNASRDCVELAKGVLAIGARYKWLLKSNQHEQISPGCRGLAGFFRSLDAMPVEKREFEWRGYTYRLNCQAQRYERVL